MVFGRRRPGNKRHGWSEPSGQRESSGQREPSGWRGRSISRWRRTDSAAEEVRQLRSSRRKIVTAFEIERRRIERDLHDGAQQYLVASNMAIGEAQLLVNMNQGELPESLQDLPAILNAAAQAGEQGLRSLRAAVNNIHPKVLSDLGLEQAVRSAAELSPVNTRVVVPYALPQMPEGVMATAYFVVAEALTNVAKYAPAATATVMLAADQDLHVSITDDGGGGVRIVPGRGLDGLRERLAAFGGSLEVNSPMGGPTHVSATIPLLLMEGESGIAGSNR
ncbi:MAG: histidine kinase [Actinomycetaceae bacterium]|nr:histidine kinase [Arcanobacterium sp.]MDD7505076.1 histidine kinase [Actinomycetaceae bacterium]MDY6142593.1 histidine kinase [Arcanobacterium sp.]